VIVNKLIYILFISLILSGCCALKSPIKRYDCQKQRAEEKIVVLTRKFPELIQPTDTIQVRDTIKIEQVEIDTSFVVNDQVRFDTIYIEKEKLKIRYIKKDSLVYLTGECEGDTIYVVQEVPIEKIVVKEMPFADKIKGWFWWLVIIVLTLLGLKRLTKFKLF
tara:strand:- start:114 stop:602 length:489 start_codon:yes stop_codon:yes gene_type:complete